jgi:hypothetical protein
MTIPGQNTNLVTLEDARTSNRLSEVLGIADIAVTSAKRAPSAITSLKLLGDDEIIIRVVTNTSIQRFSRSDHAR